MDTFDGYRRSNGSVGTRNYVGVFATVVCANEVVSRVTRDLNGAVGFMHHQGCCQTPMDVKRVTEVMIGLGRNPNLGAVLLVSLGCESVIPTEIAQAIAESGKRVEQIVIQEEGGAAMTVAKAQLIVQDMLREVTLMKTEPIPVSELVLGLKCGSSDTTQGLFANPVVGVASDIIIKAGGTSIIGETTEFIGAEHIVAEHAATPEVAAQIIALVDRMENRAKAVGCDMRGGQPTRGNIEGGLTTIEEKSLGSIAKAGSAPIGAIYEYGVKPDRKGLVMMDSPGREPEILTGLAAAGANIIAFTTGRGAPQGFPFVPVVKITGNSVTWEKLRDHMDVYVGTIMEGTENVPGAGNRVYKEILSYASGARTKAEIFGYTDSMDIYVTGPVI